MVPPSAESQFLTSSVFAQLSTKPHEILWYADRGLSTRINTNTEWGWLITVVYRCLICLQMFMQSEKWKRPVINWTRRRRREKRERPFKVPDLSYNLTIFVSFGLSKLYPHYSSEIILFIKFWSRWPWTTQEKTDSVKEISSLVQASTRDGSKAGNINNTRHRKLITKNWKICIRLWHNSRFLFIALLMERAPQSLNYILWPTTVQLPYT